nr:hypothetical protein Iba_scaffold64541CG0010 [Ipomoea batatas]GMC99288.1 hypothetical protein Iba_chr05eCG4240 [Ipomoea batatas]
MLSGIGSTSCRFLLDFRLVSGAIILSKGLSSEAFLLLLPGRLPLSLPAMLSRIGSAEQICVFLDSGLISGPRIPSEPSLNLLPSITTSLSSSKPHQWIHNPFFSLQLEFHCMPQKGDQSLLVGFE